MKKAVMYGAGNIGRGFIGQLFSESGYHVVFIDVVKDTVDRLNADGCYPIKVARREGYHEITVHNVSAVNGMDLQSVADEIASADIMATAVGVNILPRITGAVSAGIMKRYESGNHKPLNIIICENLIDANKYFEKLLKEKLPSDLHDWFDKNIGLVEASIGRMVPVMTAEMKGDNPLRVYVEEYDVLPVDKKGFRGTIPEIKNMVPYEPFDFYIQRKLYMHNMAHALTAYLGKYKGYEYIWQACKDPAIKLFTVKALQESSLAMAKEHHEDIMALTNHSDDLLYRFQNPSLGDTVDRVGKDTKRKLSPSDRLAGAAKLCDKNGILPAYICVGMAAGFMFRAEGDAGSDEIIKLVEEQGIDDAITRVCDIAKDSEMHSTIKSYYSLLKQGCDLEIISNIVEITKNKWIKNRKNYI